MIDAFLLDDILKRFLLEDLGYGDITTEAIFAADHYFEAALVTRQAMVVAGMEQVAARVFTLLDPEVHTENAVADGSRVGEGTHLLRVRGRTRSLLRAERVALNLAQRLCGIATLTAAFVEQTQGYTVRIVDTRKTTPGLRLLEKYAVRVGGGHNHRFGLSDGVLIKDNHIAACGSIAAAVEKTRRYVPHTIKIEVETDTLDQVEECLACGVDIILLDNMDTATLRSAVQLIDGRALTEASGGVRLDTVRAIAETGVDIISAGALTHSVPACDIGMDWCS